MAHFDSMSLRKGLRRISFYASNGVAYAVPNVLYRVWIRMRYAFLSPRLRDEAQLRTDYYVRLAPGSTVDPADSVSVGDFHFPWHQKIKHTAYFFELYQAVRCFPKRLRFSYLFGDVNTECKSSTFVKTRPIVRDGQYSGSVLAPLNSIRHLVFIHDKIPFREKKDIVLFRNVVWLKPHRARYLEMTVNSPLCDSGEVGVNPQYPQWVKPYMPMREMLTYKFIACLEGNDVATNLKWVMSSNSIAVMPRPKFESWFMEADLVGGVHYIEIADDYHDLEEKITYYINHPDEAEAIIRNAHAHVKRFRNRAYEHYVQLQVAKRYFQITQQ